MLNTLLESNAARTRRTGGTVASTLVHAALFAGAITVTARGPVSPSRVTFDETRTLFVVQRAKPSTPIAAPPISTPTTTSHGAPRLPTFDHVPSEIPPIDVDVTVPAASHDELARGPLGTPSQSPGTSLGGPVGPTREGAFDERSVDQPPRILGNAVSPVFPMSLRERGVGGRVSIQFVVDTTGRAEMRGLRVVEASDSLFAQSVRAVLPRYRFTPGAVRGQKVRTLVQLPFDFTLVR
jgi:periplasmic protein TonB